MTYIVPVEKALVVSFDLDSTLCSTLHRQWMIDRENGTDWTAYSMACENDDPGPALLLAQYLTKLNVPIVICSARDEAARELTLKWLHRHEVYPWLVVLDDGTHDGYSHGTWKAKKLLEIQETMGRKIAFHVDDWADVAVQTEAVGIPTMLVHEIGNALVDEKLA